MERYFAIWVCFNFKIGLPSILRIWKCWLAKEALKFCQHLLKLTRRFICLKCTAIAAVVCFDQEGPFQQAGRHVFKFRLPYDVFTHDFGLLHYSFVDVQGVWARQVMYLAILSFLPEIIGNPHFIAVMVDLISSVYITSIFCLAQYQSP